MNGQRDIFGSEEEAPVRVSPLSFDAVSLFVAPASMRGQLSAWAESVCPVSEREPNRLDDWALSVMQPLHTGGGDV